MSFRFPIRKGELLVLKGADEFDPQELSAAVEPLGFQADTTTRFDVVEQEIKRLLVDKGVSYVWNLVDLLEAVMPPTKDVGPLFTILGGMVRRLEPTKEFVVVDRYFFPDKRPADYIDSLASVLEPVVQRVQRLAVVTGPKVDKVLLGRFRGWMSSVNANCELAHHTSEAFHDRFWIADHLRGLVVGTSPNGIGVRYALVDYMREEDVREIVAALQADGFL